MNVALEQAIERANTACRYDNKARQQTSLLEQTDENGVHRGLAYGIWKCKIKLEKPFKFKTGRADCIPDDDEFPYKASREENHFNPNSNAPELVQKLQDTMGMSAEDFIATAFPIHAMIGPEVFNSFSIGAKYQVWSLIQLLLFVKNLKYAWRTNK